MFVFRGQDHSFLILILIYFLIYYKFNLILIYYKEHECPGHTLSRRPSLKYA